MLYKTRKLYGRIPVRNIGRILKEERKYMIMRRKILIFLAILSVLSLISSCGKSQSSGGQTAEVQLVDCGLCKGSGACKRCDGTGERLSYGYYNKRMVTCTSCDGTGVCHDCNGTGQLTQAQNEEYQREAESALKKLFPDYPVTPETDNGLVFKCTYCNGTGIDPTKENVDGALAAFAYEKCVKCGGEGYITK